MLDIEGTFCQLAFQKKTFRSFRRSWYVSPTWMTILHEWCRLFCRPWFDLTIPMYCGNGVSFYIPYVSHCLEKVETIIPEHSICNPSCTLQESAYTLITTTISAPFHTCHAPHRMFPSHQLKTSRNVVMGSFIFFFFFFRVQYYRLLMIVACMTTIHFLYFKALMIHTAASVPKNGELGSNLKHEQKCK